MKKISIKKIINISFGFTLLFFAYSCNNEDDVCISEKSETRFDIPQGNHDFDEQIVAWSKDYDINVLYKFILSIYIRTLSKKHCSRQKFF